MGDGKQKLTLSVDAEIVELAKSRGINISELTEQVLQSFTLRPEDTAEDALQSQRKLLFEKMAPMLKGLGTEVQVGLVDDPQGNPANEDYLDVVLTGDGKVNVVAVDQDENSEQLLYHADPAGFSGLWYYPPETIVKSFIRAIDDAKAKRKDQVASYAVLQRMVDLVVETETGARKSLEGESNVSGATKKNRPLRKRSAP